MKKENRTYLSQKEIHSKLEHYCAYQDRSHKEVEEKLREYGADRDQSDDILLSLIKDNFLNEERYACSYARGKFRIKKWGRLKIIRELKKNRVSAYCIEKGLEEIDPDDYDSVLDDLMHKKNKASKVKDLFIRRKRISEYLIRKGYEPSLVWEKLKKEILE